MKMRHFSREMMNNLHLFIFFSLLLLCVNKKLAHSPDKLQYPFLCQHTSVIVGRCNRHCNKGQKHLVYPTTSAWVLENGTAFCLHSQCNDDLHQLREQISDIILVYEFYSTWIAFVLWHSTRLRVLSDARRTPIFVLCSPPADRKRRCTKIT